MSEFHQKMKTFNNQRVIGWWASEKLDGRYFLWDGGVTRGSPTYWSRGQISTGLWSSRGNPIYAPAWFLESFPPYLLEGELFCGVGNFENVLSFTRKLVPIDSEWKQVIPIVHGFPTVSGFNMVREVKFGTERSRENGSGYVLTFDGKNTYGMVQVPGERYSDRYREYDNWGVGPTLAGQIAVTSIEHIDLLLNRVLVSGGEGLVIRNPNQRGWPPERGTEVLKLKPFHDDEAIVIGTTAGKERLLGKIGALVVDWRGKIFELGSGLNDSQREQEWIGKTVTFRYRELTKDGVPKEGRFMRERND